MRKSFYLPVLFAPTLLALAGCTSCPCRHNSAEVGVTAAIPPTIIPSPEYALQSPFPAGSEGLLRGSRLAITTRNSDADRTARQIADLGFYPTEVEQAGGGASRVFVGPTYEDPTQAHLLMADLQRSGYEMVEMLPGR